MEAIIPPSPPSSNTLISQLAPYLLAVVLVVGVIILLALGKISEQAGVGLLGVVTGGHLVKLI